MSNNLRTLKHYYNTVKQNRNHRILRRTFNKTQNNNNQLFLDKFDNVYKKSFDEPQEIDNDILSKLINLTDRYYLKNDIIENLLPYYNELSEEKPYCKINFNSFLIELQKNIYSDMLYQNANDKIMYSIKLNSDLMHKAKYFDICAHNKKTSSPPGTYGFTPTPARVPTIYGFESLKEETTV